MDKRSNVLFLCLSSGRGITERTVARDISLVSHSDVSNEIMPYLYTEKNSYLDRITQEFSCTKVYHQPLRSRRIPLLFQVKALSRVISNNGIDVVHVYGAELLWETILALRNMPFIPLVYYHTKKLDRYYRGHIYSFLRRRVDLAWASSSYMSKNLEEFIGLRAGKIAICSNPLERKNEYSLFTKVPKEFYLGTRVCSENRDLESVKTLLLAIKQIVSHDDIKLKMILLFESNYESSSFARVVYNQIIKLNLQSFVYFYTESKIERVIHSFDLWIDISDGSDSVDYAALAVGSAVPVLMPKDIIAMELLNTEFGSVGETYSKGDTRSLATKILKVFENISVIKDTIISFVENGSNKCEREGRLRELLSESVRLRKKRERFFSRGETK